MARTDMLYFLCITFVSLRTILVVSANAANREIIVAVMHPNADDEDKFALAAAKTAAKLINQNAHILPNHTITPIILPYSSFVSIFSLEILCRNNNSSN